MKTTMKLSSTEYIVGTKIDLNTITAPEAPQFVYNGLMRIRTIMKLEARMIAYDALHGTHYRKLRHAVVARDRNAAFEKSIGLVRG